MTARIYTSVVTVGTISIYEVVASPDGVLAAARGSLAVRSDAGNETLWQNVDGATTWVEYGRQPDRQIFTSSGLYVLPAPPDYIATVCCEVQLAGAGGASGRKAAAGTYRGGGGGGEGGGNYKFWLEPSLFTYPAGDAVTLGAAGVGGPAQAVNSTDGSDGADAGVTSLGAILTFLAARGGIRGSGAAPSLGGGNGIGSEGGTTRWHRAGRGGGGIGGNSTSTSPMGFGVNGSQGAGGGGGGGTITAANAILNSGGGGDGFAAGGAFRSVDGPGNVGANAPVDMPLPGGGGGGGRGAGQPGGDGGRYGGGGGGGAGGTDGATDSGAGGDGGDPIMVLTAYFRWG